MITRLQLIRNIGQFDSVNAAANIQLDVTSPNFLGQEGIETMGGLEAEIVEEPIRIEKGYIIPSTKPGLGIGRVKEELFSKHPYQTERGSPSAPGIRK
ncbi:hypothetical protein MUP00_11670 [Candidatus Bathyarchaeota archaeon]|nr:hypothetical protein [Candidatus Bathyarchaeota archaeon]